MSKIYQKHYKRNNKASISNFFHMMMNTNMRWQIYIWEMRKQGILLLFENINNKGATRMKHLFHLINWDKDFFPYFLLIIIFLNSEHGDYLKPFYSNQFRFNIIFFPSKLPNNFRGRKEKDNYGGVLGLWAGSLLFLAQAQQTNSLKPPQSFPAKSPSTDKIKKLYVIFF